MSVTDTTASTPSLGLPPVDDAKPDDSDERFWSVTTLIGVLDKPALLYWAAEQTAICAVEKQKTWQAIRSENGDSEAIDWLCGARFRAPRGQRTAKDLGTEVHKLCEQYALTGVQPVMDDECRPYFEQFDQWLQTFSPTYLATEVTVYSPEYGYGGTCDAFMEIDGVRFIVDYKTTKKSVDKKGQPTKPYPESVGLQLAAYRHAELAAVWQPRRFEQFRRRYYLLSAEERAAAVPVPEVDTGLCIHITPEHCEAYPIRCDESVHEAFLYVQEAARWVNQTSKNVMSAPLQPATRAGE